MKQGVYVRVDIFNLQYEINFFLPCFPLSFVVRSVCNKIKSINASFIS